MSAQSQRRDEAAPAAKNQSILQVRLSSELYEWLRTTAFVERRSLSRLTPVALLGSHFQVVSRVEEGIPTVRMKGWSTFAQHMSDVLDLLLMQRDKNVNRDIPLLLHTYDYVTPRNAPAGPGLGPWLYKAMHDLYAVPEADWNALSDRLIDKLAEMWVELDAKNAGRNIHIVDSRGAIARADPGTDAVSGDWENEIHPTPHGYSLLGQRWRAVLDRLP